MDRFLPLAICLAMAVLPHGVDGTAFVFNEMSCNSPVTLYVEEVKCGSSGGNECTFGDILYAKGTVGLSTTLQSSTMCSTVNACFLGSTLFCKTYEAQIDVCNDLGLRSMDGTSCPQAADYNFEAKVQLPGEGSLQLGSGWWITTYIALASCGSQDTFVSCDASFKAVSTAGQTVATGAALLGVGVLVYAIARKRRVPTIDLAKEEQLLEGNFEMMSNQSVQA